LKLKLGLCRKQVIYRMNNVAVVKFILLNIGQDNKINRTTTTTTTTTTQPTLSKDKLKKLYASGEPSSQAVQTGI
jgi:hypothetical protein